MGAECLLTLGTTVERREAYHAAAKALGTNVASIMREALEQAVRLAEAGVGAEVGEECPASSPEARPDE